ncbi:carbohydrate ABC transporter substrate-binding protein [Ruania alkalisoli]|uniref:Carbohydrate ABC transporter substrate-binding protein n=1 Tax=Ruania alkalisoli TaxID=2779775 RepID=A0A7M1SVC6_9MICO|nr:ABC transporter substrate-binding protein [Ruania alkalisoli]QOR70573.1 carbohydrate ABC transporter substrate-binding protein [Ruania alkalisoli]
MSPNISRRTALLAGASMMTAGALAGCERPGGTPTDTGAGAEAFPTTGADVPSESATVQWVDTGAISEAFVPSVTDRFTQTFPNVAFNYQSLGGDDMAQVLQLAFQNDDVPDIFRLLPNVVAPSEAVSAGLVQPLDDIVPDFETWRSAFPDGVFTEGNNVFNGKTYSFPVLGNYTLGLLLNRGIVQEAGYDFEETPPTFETFRQAAREITQQGDGRYWALTHGGASASRWRVLVQLLGQLAGAPGGDFDYRTGTYNYNSDAYLEAVELLLALREDGSFDPGVASTPPAQAVERVPTGQAAMIINETGVLPKWFDTFPDFDFGVANLPAPADHGYVAAPSERYYWWASASSQNPEVIGELFSYLGSVEGQSDWQRVGGGALPLAFPEVNQVEGLDPRVRAAYDYFDEVVRRLPEPPARNPETAQVLAGLRPLSPDFGTTIQGIYTGQLEDPAAAMRNLQDRAEAELDRAVDAAVAEGANVSRDDWVFADWDPSVNYVYEDGE